jgi:glycosyltransferase involved in cell wall biosynthesis
MKILVAHNFYKEPGGEDQCVEAEVAMLKAHGHEVIRYQLHNHSIDGIKRLQVACRTIWSRAALSELRELFRRHRPQIAHFHNTFPLMSPAAYYAAKAENVGVVQTLHNFRLLCVNGNFLRDGKVCEDCLGGSIAWRGVVHKCYRNSIDASAVVATMQTVHRAIGTWRNAVDAYVALTNFSRRKLIEGGLPADKIAVKPNFVFPDPGRGPGMGGYAVFVGRLSAEKGIMTLLEAWRILGQNIPLKIIGDGPLASVVREAAASNATIEWLGRLPLESVYSMIGNATFLVTPSICYETFGRAAIEAFAAGIPVIASRQGAMSEIVDDGRTGLLFEPGDPCDLAKKVRGILADPLRLKSMRDAARREFDQYFTAGANHACLMSIYEGVLSGCPQPGTRQTESPRRICDASTFPRV